MDKHRLFMKETLRLAERGRGATSPNPMVGAAVVKNGRIISSAYHRRVGGLHAEALALRKIGVKAKGATLYVSLEPCAHEGRTPPCTEAIINSGIKKVYCAMIDPNPLNNGRGVRELRRHNIDVNTGLLESEARKLNEVFIKYVTKKMPFVTLKSAESLDGKIATRDYDSKWISSDSSRSYVHKLRSEVDAVLVGINTIIRDNPLLISRSQRSPIKVILDPDLRIPENARILSKASPALNIIAVLKNGFSKKSTLEKIRRLAKKGVMVIGCPVRQGRINLKELLKELAVLEVAHLLVEGGGDTAAGFIESGLVDRALFFIAPKIIGGRDAITSVEGRGVDRISNSVRLKNIKVERIAEDILVQGDIN